MPGAAPENDVDEGVGVVMVPLTEPLGAPVDLEIVVSREEDEDVVGVIEFRRREEVMREDIGRGVVVEVEVVPEVVPEEEGAREVVDRDTDVLEGGGPVMVT